MNVGMYGRISTSDKDQNLETQLLPLREFCAAQGWTVHEEYVDQVSATDLARRTQWREHRGRHGRNVAQRFGRKQDADPVGGAAKRRRCRPRIAQFHERVVDQGMFNDVKGHAEEFYSG